VSLVLIALGVQVVWDRFELVLKPIIKMKIPSFPEAEFPFLCLSTRFFLKALAVG
jgi:hypothetical protein